MERAGDGGPELRVGARQVEREDGVGSGAHGVHLRRGRRAMQGRRVHQIVDRLVIRGVDFHFVDPVAVGLSLLVLLDGQVQLGGPFHAQEVEHLLVVDLDESNLHSVGPALLLHVVAVLSDLADALWDDARHLALAVALHRVGLARACLPVREEAHVVAVERGLHELGHLEEDLVLGGGAGEGLVERVLVRLDHLPFLYLPDLRRRAVLLHIDGGDEGDLVLVLVRVEAECPVVAAQEGTHADVDADVPAELLDLVVHLPPLDVPLAQLLLLGFEERFEALALGFRMLLEIRLLLLQTIHLEFEAVDLAGLLGETGELVGLPRGGLELVLQLLDLAAELLLLLLALLHLLLLVLDVSLQLVDLAVELRRALLHSLGVHLDVADELVTHGVHLAGGGDDLLAHLLLLDLRPRPQVALHRQGLLDLREALAGVLVLGRLLLDVRVEPLDGLLEHLRLLERPRPRHARVVHRAHESLLLALKLVAAGVGPFDGLAHLRLAVLRGALQLLEAGERHGQVLLELLQLVLVVQLNVLARALELDALRVHRPKAVLKHPDELVAAADLVLELLVALPPGVGRDLGRDHLLDLVVSHRVTVLRQELHLRDLDPPRPRPPLLGGALGRGLAGPALARRLLGLLALFLLLLPPRTAALVVVAVLVVVARGGRDRRIRV
mmetsp:Transcript_71066/g.160806  ORF Transcript_71066/g.160806 Transcript_71066/m.160806 type:complete len:668 (-) Transcript_71066:670-2673(-)